MKGGKGHQSGQYCEVPFLAKGKIQKLVINFRRRGKITTCWNTKYLSKGKVLKVIWELRAIFFFLFFVCVYYEQLSLLCQRSFHKLERITVLSCNFALNYGHSLRSAFLNLKYIIFSQLKHIWCMYRTMYNFVSWASNLFQLTLVNLFCLYFHLNLIRARYNNKKNSVLLQWEAPYFYVIFKCIYLYNFKVLIFSIHTNISILTCKKMLHHTYILWTL